MTDEFFRVIKDSVSVPGLMENTEKLWTLEFGQRYSDYKASAGFAESLLKKSGLSEVETISFPADGRTVFQDKTMPLCWEASVGRMRVLESPAAFDDPLVADLDRHPFHLIKGSVSTPPGGVRAKVITFDQMFQGEDARGAMVIAPPDSRDKKGLYTALCDFGALGMVYDWLGARYETPDNLHWANGWTEGPHWHAIEGERPLVGFCVTPRTGDMLRNAARRGPVTAHVESDGRLFPGETDVVTGIVPGLEKRELWLLAHLYEPLSADNSTGVACASEIARIVQTLASSGRIPAPRFTLRVILGLEMYGFAAYAHSRGGYLGDLALGAVNLDGVAVSRSGEVAAVMAPPASCFAGNYFAEYLAENWDGIIDVVPDESGMYGDDMFLNDSTTNLPTVWFHQMKGFWHNSVQTMDIIDGDVLGDFTAFACSWVHKMISGCSPEDATACHKKSEAKIFGEYEKLSLRLAEGSIDAAAAASDFKLRIRREAGILRGMAGISSGEARALAAQKAVLLEKTALAELKKIESAPAAEFRDIGRGLYGRIAGTMVSRRISRGIPYDLAAAPRSERRILPDRIIYGPLSRILSNMDGEKSVAELIDEAVWEASLSRGSSHALETGRDALGAIGEPEIRDYISAVEFLTKWGYLDTRYSSVSGPRDISRALEGAGAGRGDVLFVHSSLSAFGHVEGGAEAVIDSLLDVIGSEGTLIMPAFTRSFIYFDGSCMSYRKPVPFDAGKPEDVVVGGIPKAFLRRKGVLRSSHPTHSVAAWGRLAESIVGGHHESDPPCSGRSALGVLPGAGGKILWFGADLSSTTFLHFLEYDMNLPYLAGAVCTVKNPDGSLRSVLTPMSVPGHRDFYRRPGECSKIFRRLLSEGLEIKESPLGFGAVRLAEAGEMYRLGKEALSEDPAILLCDEPECDFCRRGRELTKTPGRPDGYRS